MQPGSEAHAPRWYRGLRAQVIFLLSLAAIPIGLVAIYQTNRTAEAAAQNAELALLALSDRAVQSQRLVIQRAFGTANMLGAVMPSLISEPEECSNILSTYVEDQPSISFIGVLPDAGDFRCTSANDEVDLSDVMPALTTDGVPQPNIAMNSHGPMSEVPVVVVSVPYAIEGDHAGYVSVVIPQRELTEQEAFAHLPVEGLIALFTFNERGSILAGQGNDGAIADRLPQDTSLSALHGQESQSFRGPSQSGDEYIYTLVPIVDGQLTVMGVWSPTTASEAALIRSPVPTSAFPALMWFASVLVAIMALYTLVIRHINTLRRQMARFSDTREVPEVLFDSAVPNELADIQVRFLNMTDDILREEARLEGMVREQNVLAKEVHHRVKNNLQMIASIMNMQIRNAEQDETVVTLQKVQDRITALAEVHKDLYSTEDHGRTNAGALVRRTVQNSMRLGVQDRHKVNLETKIEDVWLFPDQVVSLSLLATEAITNALKYISAPDGQTPQLRVQLHQDGDDCVLIVANSAGDSEIESGTGIGEKLIRAFAIKLGTQPETTRSGDMYTLTLRFQIAEFEAEEKDY